MSGGSVMKFIKKIHIFYSYRSLPYRGWYYLVEPAFFSQKTDYDFRDVCCTVHFWLICMAVGDCCCYCDYAAQCQWYGKCGRIRRRNHNDDCKSFVIGLFMILFIMVKWNFQLIESFWRLISSMVLHGAILLILEDDKKRQEN